MNPAKSKEATVWTRTTMRFRFQIGEWTFAARRLPIAVPDKYFLQLGEAASITLPQGFDDCICYVILSQPLSKRLPLLSWHAGMLRYAPHQYEHAIVIFDSDFETYLSTQFPRDRKKKLLYLVRRLCRHLGSDAPVRDYRSEAEFHEFHRMVTTLSSRTYQTRLLGRSIADERLDEWARLAGEGKARGWLLFHGERPIAFIAGRVRGDIFDNEYIGYDPEYADFGPGNVLQYFVLKQLFAEKGYRVWDFGEGEGLHKSRFANRRVPCGDLYYFPLRGPSLALLTSQAALHIGSRSAVGALDRLHLKERVKRLLRRSAGHG